MSDRELYETEPWEADPADHMEAVFGPNYFITDEEIDRAIHPMFRMYWVEYRFQDLQREGEALRFP